MIIIFIISQSDKTLANLPFDYERLSVNFNGVAYNGSSIICYGDGGIILRSTDGGHKWEQKKIADDVYSITKVMAYGNSYFGLLDSNFIVFSTDNGKNWDKININDKTKFYDFDLDSNFIYFLSNSQIKIYDLDMKEIEVFGLDSNCNARLIKNYKYYFILSDDSCRIYFIGKTWDVDSHSFDFRKDFSLNNSDKIEKIEISNNEIFVLISGTIYKSTDAGSSFKKLFDKINLFEIYKDKVYNVNSRAYYLENISYIDFYKEEQGTLKKINNDNITRYVSSQFYTGFKFINDDTIIAVGKQKLINISHDGGKNWNFISSLGIVNYLFSYWVNDSLGYFYTDKYQISKTTNGGITWLPQVYNYQRKGSYEISLPDAWYIDNKGYVILFASTNLQKQDNFLFSKDFGENYITISNSKLIGYIDDIYRPVIIKKDSCFLLFYCVKGYRSTHTLIFELDSNLTAVDKKQIDSISIIFAKNDIENNKIVAIGIEKRYPNGKDSYDSVNFLLMYSYDEGKTWLNAIKFNIEHRFIQYTEIDNYIFFYSYIQDRIEPKRIISSIDILDLKNKIFYPRTFSDTLSLRNFFTLKDAIYSPSNFMLIMNNDLTKHPYKWEKVSMNQFFSIGAKYSNNNIMYGVAGFEPLKSNLYKFTPLIPDKVEEEKINYPVYFWPMNPYPMPAKNQIFCHIFTSMNFNTDNSSVAVYDINGKSVSEKSDII
ncbi:MAG: YCF48-related protein, partial [Candidatus Woesearchaeota archaeon]